MIFRRFGELLRVIMLGWIGVGRALIGWIGEQLSRMDIMQIAFVIASLALAFAGLAPWITYEVDLMSPETPSRGSNYRTLFILPAILGLFLYLSGTAGRYRLPLYYGGVILVAILYVAGIIFPNPVHTYIRETNDYSLNPWVFVYGGFLVLAAVTGRGALQRPLFTPDDLKRELLETRHARPHSFEQE